MEIRILGPVHMRLDDGREVQLGTRQQRFILAVLALEANTPVSTHRLIDLVWPCDPPNSARGMVHTYISGLRTTLAHLNAVRHGVHILRGGAGYLLRCPPDRIDAFRFRTLLHEAGEATEDNRRVAALDEALSLWHGPALAGACAEDIRLRLAGCLEEARLIAVEDRIDAQLRLGHHRQLGEQLASLVAEYPNRQRLVGQLMLALYRDGRVEEALSAYRRNVRRLANDLGIDPPEDLQQLHVAMLGRDPVPGTPTPTSLDLPIPSELAGHPAQPATGPGTSTPTGQDRPVPAQLPADLDIFTGRHAQLAELDARLLAGQQPAGQAPATVVLAISGTAGVGKTALAIHWAHQVRDRFPDGQLHANLRGFDPSGQVMAPTEALHGFLDALGVAPGRIPPDLHDQAALYRSLLAGRRVLIVLDNARDAQQIRPLLPGAATCLVLVTSRDQLTGLIAVDCAHPVALDVFSPAEARQLLVGRTGEDRLSAEPDAAEQIIRRCAGLPLALAIAAARARAAGFPLGLLAAELSDAHNCLDALDAGDVRADVRAVFSWSYRTLTPAAARLFRMLGLHPGADLSAPAAASLADLTPRRVRPLLAQLTQANLVVEQASARYTFHDLLRVYATDLAYATDPEPDRHAATVRLLDHYIHTAHAADRLLFPARDPIPIPLTPPAPGATVETLTDESHAIAWLGAQWPVLLATLHHAADAGLDRRAWQLAWALDTFLDRQGHWHELADAWQTAWDAVSRLGDPAGQALTQRRLAQAHNRIRHTAHALAHSRRALDLYRRLNDQAGQAYTHHNLAVLLGRQGQIEPALEHSQQALALHRAAGHRRGQAVSLNASGWFHALLGDYRQAVAYCQEALALHQQLHDRHGEAATWDSLGYAHHHLGRHDVATDCYQHAVALLRDVGDRYNEADVLNHLGDTHHATGRFEAARTTWQQALAIFHEFGHPDAQQLRAKLRALDAATARRECPAWTAPSR